jgi:hypothetical protein
VIFSLTAELKDLISYVSSADVIEEALGLLEERDNALAGRETATQATV